MNNKAAQDFLTHHELAVLSTISRDGSIQGAVVYYYVNDDGSLYFLTKAETQKAHAILANHQVAVTIYDQNTLQTLQMQGTAAIEADSETKQAVFSHITRKRTSNDQETPPPVTQMENGAFIIFKITPTTIKFSDYRSK